MQKAFVIILLSMLVSASQAQPPEFSPMFLDFTHQLPFIQKGFYVFGDSHYRVSIDSQIVQAGTNSLRFEFIKSKLSKRKVGTAMSSFDADKVRGKKITFSAYIRTKDVSEGEAILSLFTTTADRPNTSVTLDGRGAKGTSDWKQYSLELEVSSTAERVYFYAYHKGNGTVWFDDLNILIDGEPFKESDLPPVNTKEILEALTAIREGTFDIDLDFEHGGNTPRGSGLWHYFRNDEYYQASFDSAIVYSGKRSLRIDFLKEGDRTIGMANLQLPIEQVRGSLVTFTGYVRTKDVTDGEAYLWMRVDRETDDDESSEIIAFDDSSARGGIGTTPWKQYKIEHVIDPNATTVIFGLLHTGKGTVWLDNVEVLVNGKPFDKGLPRKKEEEHLNDFIDLQKDPSGLNLDFEKVVDGNPETWQFLRKRDTSKSHIVTSDSLVAYSNRYSLRIDGIRQSRQGGRAQNYIDAVKIRGKRLTFTGYIRTKDVGQGGAGLFMSSIGGSWESSDMDDSSVTGTTDWRQYRIELPIDTGVVRIEFGASLKGTGTAWFDKLELLVDGKPYSNDPFLSKLTERFRSDTVNLNAEQLAWLKKNARPFKTAQAGSGFEDLRFLKDLIGDAEILGLGEATHGTKEFFQMKHRVLEYVAHQYPHTIFVLEDNMGGGTSIDRYIHTDDTNSSETLVQKLYWPWSNKEVQEMVDWMKTFNAAGKHTVDFRGCDMQSGYISRVRLTNFLKEYDSAFYKFSEANFTALVNAINTTAGKPFERDTALRKHINFAIDVRNYLQDKRSEFARTESKKIEKIIPSIPLIDNIIQDANLLAQTATYYLSGFNFQESFEFRDTCMAANIRWIKEHSPKDAKIVIWAHNGHVMKNNYMSAYTTMGSHLRKFYGDAYRILGFKFHEGSYLGVELSSGLGKHDVRPSYPGTLDWALRSADVPNYMLDLRKTRKDDPVSGWLHQPLMSKTIGAVVTPLHYFPENAGASYDVLIFFDKTTSAHNISPFPKKDK